MRPERVTEQTRTGVRFSPGVPRQRESRPTKGTRDVEAGEDYLGLICVFAATGGFFGALITAIALTLWRDGH